MQEMEATVVDGNGTEAGHIIVTTIGGKNGQPKQVYFCFSENAARFLFAFSCTDMCGLLIIVDNKLHG